METVFGKGLDCLLARNGDAQPLIEFTRMGCSWSRCKVGRGDSGGQSGGAGL